MNHVLVCHPNLQPEVVGLSDHLGREGPFSLEQAREPREVLPAPERRLNLNRMGDRSLPETIEVPPVGFPLASPTVEKSVGSNVIPDVTLSAERRLHHAQYMTSWCGPSSSENRPTSTISGEDPSGRTTLSSTVTP